jgi:hypothetical protein
MFRGLQTSVVWVPFLSASLVAHSAASAPPLARDDHRSVLVGDTDSTKPLSTGKTPSNFTPAHPQATPPPANLPAAVGWLEGAKCTVFHVGNGLAVTAGHCFLPGGGEHSSPFACSDSVRWGVEQLRGSNVLVDTGSSQCRRGVVARYKDEEDYAVVRVDPAPSVFLTWSDAVPPRGTPLQLLGYPSGPPLQYPAGGCSAHPGSDTPWDALKQSWIVAYKCDTALGNSGSPVFRADNWSVVAIHSGGKQSDALTNDGWNWATTISQVSKVLAASSM